VVIIMQAGAPEQEVEAVIKAVEKTGFRPWVNPGVERKVIALLGAMDAEKIELVDHFSALPGVERVTLISEPYKLPSRRTHPDPAIPVLKRFSHLPVIADPSHATGDWRYVTAVALAAVAGGADGIMVEVHPDPTVALSDGPQSLRPEKFGDLMRSLRKVAAAVGRELRQPVAQ